MRAQLTRYWALAGSQTVNLTNSVNLINGVLQPQSNGTSIYATWRRYTRTNAWHSSARFRNRESATAM